ncbi:MAG: azurin [Lautropia sp.]
MRLGLAVAVAGSPFAISAQAQGAGDCAIEVGSNDQMRFDKDSITIPGACREYKVTLKHTGKLPKAAMGHNWVLTRTADMAGVAKDAITAGLGKEYLKPGDDRVIAATKLIGGGETTSVTVDASKLKAGEGYSFFCSFPGHSSLMKGTLTVAP